MVGFTTVFLPMFSDFTGGLEMVDAYLLDYTKSIFDIETLIIDYGEKGRGFMPYFFIVDSIYVIISCTLFSFLIQAVTAKKHLSYIPFITGALDTAENLIVLYTGTTLNMDFLFFARIFATAKAFFLFTSLFIILVGFIKFMIHRNKKLY